MTYQPYINPQPGDLVYIVLVQTLQTQTNELYGDLRRNGMPAITVGELAVISPISLYIPASVHKVCARLISVQPIGCSEVITTQNVYTKTE